MIGIGDEVIFFVSLLPLIFIPVYFLMYSMRNFFARQREPSLAPQGGESSQDFPRESFNNADYLCPICLNQIDLPVETNCGHKFCGSCILENWRVWRAENIGPLKCPLCRTLIRMLLPLFSVSSGIPESRLRRQEAINQLNVYTSRHAHDRSYWQMIMDVPVLIRHLLADLREMGGLSQLFLAKLVVCVVITGIYLVCPIDMLPEAFLGFLGLVDDFLVVLLFFFYVSRMYYGIVQARANTD